MADAIPTVTDEELTAHGFIPGNIMGSPRLKGWPVKLRHGDDLIERDEFGNYTLYFGYFTAEQIEHRRLVSRIMCEKFARALKDSSLARYMAGEGEENG